MAKDLFDNILDRTFSLKESVYLNKKIIEKVSSIISNKIYEEGRIIFVGAGLSSEMAKIIIDELWFNFKINKEKFLVLTASKKNINYLENWKKFEEIKSISIFELNEIGLNKKDILIGLSSSGKTEYTISAIKYGTDLGCETVIITDIKNCHIKNFSKYIIDIKLGEVSIFGLNSVEGGTIQKIILDLIIYLSMQKAGKIYKNKLVFINPVSSKLTSYCLETISYLTGLSLQKSKIIFNKNNQSLETTLVSFFKNVNYNEAKKILEENKYNFLNSIK